VPQQLSAYASVEDEVAHGGAVSVAQLEGLALCEALQAQVRQGGAELRRGDAAHSVGVVAPEERLQVLPPHHSLL